jgi:GH25 family lysozyme M1 (1,4-beta-N-acetylmuramidase)
MTIFPATEVYPYTLVDATEVPVCVPDISTWQGEVDADKFIAAGAHGVIVRAGSIDNISGVCYTDYQYDANIERFSGKIPMGAYWYYRPNHDPLKQADYFSVILRSNDWHIAPVADVECNPNNNTQYQVQGWLYKFISRLADNLPDSEWPMIYTSGSLWNTIVGDYSWASAYDLWVARYTSLPKPWGNPGDQSWLRPLPWNDWRLWQWSANGNGRGHEFGAESYDIDLNRYNGSLSDFYAWCNWNQEPPPEPPEEPCDCLQHVIDFWDRVKKSGDDILDAWRN